MENLDVDRAKAFAGKLVDLLESEKMEEGDSSLVAIFAMIKVISVILVHEKKSLSPTVKALIDCYEMEQVNQLKNMVGSVLEQITDMKAKDELKKFHPSVSH